MPHKKYLTEGVKKKTFDLRVSHILMNSVINLIAPNNPTAFKR